MSETSKEPARLVVLVCYDCHKLIGTRENYHMERRRSMRFNETHFVKVALCEACHDVGFVKNKAISKSNVKSGDDL